jgi:hypothetical protein
MEWPHHQIGTSTTTSPNCDNDTRMASTMVLPNTIRVTVGLTAILCVDHVSTLPRNVGLSLPTIPLDLQVSCDREQSVLVTMGYRPSLCVNGAIVVLPHAQLFDVSLDFCCCCCSRSARRPRSSGGIALRSLISSRFSKRLISRHCGQYIHRCQPRTSARSCTLFSHQLCLVFGSYWCSDHSVVTSVFVVIVVVAVVVVRVVL